MQELKSGRFGGLGVQEVSALRLLTFKNKIHIAQVNLNIRETTVLVVLVRSK